MTSKGFCPGMQAHGVGHFQIAYQPTAEADRNGILVPNFCPFCGLVLLDDPASLEVRGERLRFVEEIHES